MLFETLSTKLHSANSLQLSHSPILIISVQRLQLRRRKWNPNRPRISGLLNVGDLLSDPLTSENRLETGGHVPHSTLSHGLLAWPRRASFNTFPTERYDKHVKKYCLLVLLFHFKSWASVLSHITAKSGQACPSSCLLAQVKPNLTIQNAIAYNYIGDPSHRTCRSILEDFDWSTRGSLPIPPEVVDLSVVKSKKAEQADESKSEEPARSS